MEELHKENLRKKHKECEKYQEEMKSLHEKLENKEKEINKYKDTIAKLEEVKDAREQQLQVRTDVADLRSTNAAQALLIQRQQRQCTMLTQSNEHLKAAVEMYRKKFVK